MTQTAKRITDKDPAKKLAHQRLSTLQLAEVLGNVSEACRRGNIDRTSFYEWKRRFQTHGFEGLKDMPPVHKYHPQTTPPEVVDKMHRSPALGLRQALRLAQAARRVGQFADHPEYPHQAQPGVTL